VLPAISPASPDTGLSAELFALVCDHELHANGRLSSMTPTGGETGSRHSALMLALQSYARVQGGWKVFNSSTGFRRLPVAARLLRRSWLGAQP
jgi:Uma2 family endonuclease